MITCPYCGAVEEDCIPSVALINVERYGDNVFVVRCKICEKKVKATLIRKAIIVDIEETTNEFDFSENQMKD